MTTFLLVRHASVDGLGIRLNGRQPGVHLNEQGQMEAVQLARRLAGIHCEAIYSSPMERTQETAQAIANELGAAFTVHTGLNEIDYGRWTGKSFRELDTAAEWHRYNACRHTAEIPGGESMQQLWQRVHDTAERLRSMHEGIVMLVTHADWIRAITAHYTCASLDLFQRFQVLPASLSVLRLLGQRAEVAAWNETGSLISLMRDHNDQPWTTGKVNATS